MSLFAREITGIRPYRNMPTYLPLRKPHREPAEEEKSVPSETTPGMDYLLRKVNGAWTCNCPGYWSHKHCKHTLRAYNEEHPEEPQECRWCHTTLWAVGGLDAAHIRRRSADPARVHDPTNIVALCRKCHERATIDKSLEVLMEKVWNTQDKKRNLKQS